MNPLDELLKRIILTDGRISSVSINNTADGVGYVDVSGSFPFNELKNSRATETNNGTTKKDTRIPKHSLNIPMHPDYVKAIYVDEVARVVVVVFYNGEKEVVKCSENDEFDVSVGVALGIARYLFGNHTKFYKHVVAKKTFYTKKLDDVNVKPSEYQVYYEWCVKNHKRIASETTFKKNKNKYLAKMKGEN